MSRRKPIHDNDVSTTSAQLTGDKDKKDIMHQRDPSSDDDSEDFEDSEDCEDSKDSKSNDIKRSIKKKNRHDNKHNKHRESPIPESCNPSKISEPNDGTHKQIRRRPVNKHTKYKNSDIVNIELESCSPLKKIEPNEETQANQPEAYISFEESDPIERFLPRQGMNQPLNERKIVFECLPYIEPKTCIPSIFYIIVGVVVVLISLIVVLTYVSPILYQEDKEDKTCNFTEKLKNQYPNEGDRLWEHLSFGVKNILKFGSEKPAVYLLLHNGNSKAQQLILDIAGTASLCFGESAKVKNIDFTSKEAINDYGNILEEYKGTIKEGNVVLIANVNEIPGEAAKALHSICDTITPLVKKVIILLSLKAARKTDEDNVIHTAENTLRQLWESKVKPFELDPIITRVTDQVFQIQSK